MRPLLKPALRRFWRDRRTVQFGVDPDHAVVVTGLDPELAGVLDDLNGERSRSDILRAARARGVDHVATARLLDLLADAGVLDTARPVGMRLSGLSPTERMRLLPDMRALSLHRGESGIPGMVARRKSTVVMYGAGRVGGTVAATLASAGIGRLLISDRAAVREADLAPGGLEPTTLGGDRAKGIRRRIRAVARSTRVGAASATRTRPDLAIVAPDEEPDRGLLAGLVRWGVPHLVVRVVEGRGLIGPFVLPGQTSCVRCSDLYRADRDPAYPRLLAQSLTEQSATRACDVALAGLVGNLAAMHALQYVGGERPVSCGTTVEISSPHGEQRRRRWPAHPDCGCHWDHLADAPADGDADQANEAGASGRAMAAPTGTADRSGAAARGGSGDAAAAPDVDLEMAGTRLFP